ncbi:FUSC family protein [Sphaerisporangium sp. NPDC051011]|uniref:FUSC family protein n=1 Tax=Sphaerisporangium sp. NPDC051011 TaxID=3155792 RepID=UPI0033D62A74
MGAALAWVVAVQLLGHKHPLFAPISVMICVGVGLGQRLRRVVELVVGVSLGVGIGDLLVSWIGSGPWQMALVIALAMTVAGLLNSGELFVSQVGSSAVLVSMLVPGVDAGGLNRMADALVGGVVGIAAVALLPASPLSIAGRHLSGVLDAFSTLLEQAAEAIEKGDMDVAAEALECGRRTQAVVEEFAAALENSKEIIRISPLRRHHRARLARYETAAVPVDLALRNARVLARRTLAALGEAGTPPVVLAELMREVSEAALLLQLELGAGREPSGAAQEPGFLRERHNRANAIHRRRSAGGDRHGSRRGLGRADPAALAERRARAGLRPARCCRLGRRVRPGGKGCRSGRKDCVKSSHVGVGSASRGAKTRESGYFLALRLSEVDSQVLVSPEIEEWGWPTSSSSP